MRQEELHIFSSGSQDCTRLLPFLFYFILFIIFHRVAVDTLYCRVVFIYLFIFELAL